MSENILNDKGLSFERLKSLTRVAEYGGLSKAAPDDVSRQNLIGRQLRDLEAFFRIELTQKKGKALVLNEQGEHLARLALQIIGLIENFKKEAITKRRVFRFAAGGSLYSELAAVRIPKLKSLGLDIRLRELRHEQIFETLYNSEIDGALAWEKPPHSLRLSSINIGSFGYSLFGAKSLIQERMTENSIFRLPFAVVLHRDNSKAIQEKMKGNEVVLVDENLPALRLVESKEYVAILPTLYSSCLKLPEYRTLKFDFLGAYSRKVSYLWNPRSAAIRGFSRSWMEDMACKFALEEP